MINSTDIYKLKELDLETQQGTAPETIKDIKQDIEYYKELKIELRNIIRGVITNKKLKHYFDEEEKQGKHPYLSFDIPLNQFDCKIKNCERWIVELENIMKKEVKKSK